MAVQRSRLIILGALLARAISAQNCDYSESTNCIKAEASASVKIEFEPLFSSPPTFVFGIDNMEDQDIQDMLNADDGLEGPVGDNPAQAVAWWLEYENNTVNSNPIQKREYHVWALESNSNNSIGGNDGGCEDLLGAKCVSDLKSLFTSVGDRVNYELKEFFESPPERINCPTVIWGDGASENRGFWEGVYATPLLESSDEFATIGGDYTFDELPPPSGSASSTHSFPRMRYRSLEQQKAISIIAFNLGRSLSGGGRDNMTINMACLRVGEAPNEESGNSDNNAAGKSVAISSTMVLGFIAALWAFII